MAEGEATARPGHDADGTARSPSREGYSVGAQDEILGSLEEAPNYNAWLLERAQPYLGKRVLDVGAGTGTFTEVLARDSELVVALEPEDLFAARLRERFDGRPNVSVLAGDVDALRSADFRSPFDSVVCFNVLEHIRDDAGALDVLSSVLAPGGHVLLLVPAHPVLHGATDVVVGHERRYHKRRVARLLDATGFELVELRHVNPVGAAGWLVSSRLLRRRDIPVGPLRLYDRFVPVLRALDRLDVGFGLSIWAVGRRCE